MVDKDVLEGWLADGLSLEEMGRRGERHPSTVGYWLTKHGLTAVGRSAHAPRGGIDRALLGSLVEEGLSGREIAQRLSVSHGTVRHWLARYALQTRRTGLSTRTPDPSGTRTVATCEVHGETAFVVRRDGYLACCACRSDSVSRWRRRVKAVLIREAGGVCVLCGYDGAPAALHFHHSDPRSKRFSIGGRGLGRSIEALRGEAAKCVLLCATCHAEVESGYTDLPATMTPPPLLETSGVAHGPG